MFPADARGTQPSGPFTPASGDSYFGSSAPSPSLPKGGGAIRGIGEKFAANPVTGSGSISVPIATSPGRSGFGPQLSLSYDSGAGNGPFGFGWSPSLPAITRKTDKGLPQYLDAVDSDTFVLSGAEDLVAVLDQPLRTVDHKTYRIRRYRPRTEGLFARIERWTNANDTSDVLWRSISRDNITTWYGKTDESRIVDPDPAEPRRIFSWLICQSHDDKGNVIVYGYKAEDSARIFEDAAGNTVPKVHERNRSADTRKAQRYLKSIRYGNRAPYFPALNADDVWPEPPNARREDDASENWMFEAVFDYGEHDDNAPTPSDAGLWPARQDPFSSYRAGFEIRTYRICHRALMFHHFPGEAGVGRKCLVRSTDFKYSDTQTADDADRSVYAFLTTVTQTSCRPSAGGYDRRSLPPVEFAYTKAIVQETIEEVDRASLENMPIGVDEGTYRWTDVHGEGTPGILTEQAGAWFYKRNLSPLVNIARFSPLETVAQRPSVALSAGAQFMDLAGDGQPDVVMMDGPTPGLYEHDAAEGWQPFRPFASGLQRDFRDPNLKFIDLDGDGNADVLISEDNAFVWYSSLAEHGFGPARRVAQALDEEKGPRLLFSDESQSIFLADMCGDGLTDLVRVRNSGICYWPNLGYGRFGAKVTMTFEDQDGRSACFDQGDQFDRQRLRLADIDGSGTTDIIYLHRDGVRLYFNQSGNGWSQPYLLTVFPRIDALLNVVPTDLLGNGTACLVWSSPLPGDSPRPMRYVNLMGGQKPHLLVKTTNNLGAETRIAYAPSTKFYLRDKQAGTPWITRLPFPVHVVERVETYDHVSRNRFVTRYAYHHGYFDGLEREFRGFGMVEQWDTEQFAALGDGQVPATDSDAATHLPPVLTRTWFHTGICLDRERVSRQFEHEYFRAPGLTIDAARPLLLDDTVIPTGLSPDEEREACRALKGSMLRQEVYALDGIGRSTEYPSGLPYSVIEQNLTIRRLQSRGDNPHAVFFTHPREAITWHYERKPADPRIQHSLTLEVDGFGNVLKQAAIAYGRRGSPLAEAWDREQQTRALLTYTENRVTTDHDTGGTAIDRDDSYRVPRPCEILTFELTGYTPTGGAGRYQTSDFIEPDPASPGRWRHKFTDEAHYESAPTATACRRPIESQRTIYRRDDLNGLLPLGDLQPLALAGESYTLAFTPGLLDQTYTRGRQGQPDEPLVPAAARAALLGGRSGDQGGYVDLDGNGHWWIPSGRTFFSPNPGDTPAAELAHARQHFFLPRRYQDPFEQNAFVDFDVHDLLMSETRDALDNRVTVGANDYRVLQPRLIIDPNRNQTEVAFDLLGMVVATAVKGKPAPAPPDGDSLSNLVVDLTEVQLGDFFDADDPRSTATALLKDASTRIIYDLDRFRRTQQESPSDPTRWKPVCAATIARETHVNALLPPQGLKIQLRFGYSDGFGREIQHKMQAGPGPLDVSDPQAPLVNPRWIGSGWTIFNNKGKPVRQYEPFFGATHRFEFCVITGVSPVLFYDPLERVIATLHPNHTYDKLVVDPWQQTTYDVNDTCAARNVQTGDPRTDSDIRGYVAQYFTALPSTPGQPWQTWHAQRVGGALGQDEHNAARRAEAHADTPATAQFDTLGRPFLTISRNRYDWSEDSFATRVALDIEGNQREVRDAAKQAGDSLGRVVMRYAYDMLGNRIRQLSMEAGARWMLNDVTGKPIRSWDSRGHNFTTTFDALRRPIAHTVHGTSPDSDPRTVNRELLVDTIEYGEGMGNGHALNLRTRIYRHSDAVGVATSARLDSNGNPTEAYDFKGNLLHSTRRLVSDYKAIPDWRDNPSLEAELFEGSTRYDALNRPIQSIAPHSSRTRLQHPDAFNVIQPVFNETNLLKRVDVWLERATEPTVLLDRDSEAPSLAGVTDIDYDAKGQRLRIDYKNGATTSYSYDPLTFRLTQLVTRRQVAAFPDDDPQPPLAGWPGRHVQNLHYTYDPSGNITHIQDEAQQAVYFRNQRIEPSNDYFYDALYRLVQAEGREHLGQLAGGARQPPTAPDGFNAFHTGLDHPGNGQAMGTYTERYVYDAVGNFVQMHHRGSDPAHAGWTRSYDYLETSSIEDGRSGTLRKMSNRLSRTTVNPNAPNPPEVEPYQHDVHGNMVRMPHLGGSGPGPNMHWDFKDQLHQADRGGGGTAYYVYDAAGQRVRKVWEKSPGVTEERIYLGGVEIFRRHSGAVGVGTATLERETLHVMDDKRRIALVEIRTLDSAGGDPAPRRQIRYEFGNHLGSISLELDESSQIISYEEYAPYGSSTYQAVRSRTETAKRYRYTGKERDDESGFYYHGARYYAAWLGTWVTPDPLGVSDGPNGYLYGHCAPLSYVDPDGRQNKRTPDPETSMSVGGEDVTFETIQRGPWKKAWNAGKDATMSEPVTIDIDEPLAVGEKGISTQEQFSRATDVENRTFRLSTENRITKWTRTEVGAKEVRGPVSLADDPSALFTRRFGDVKELRTVFEEASKKYADSPYDPVALKNKINAEVRQTIKTGKTEAAREVRAALEKVNYNPDTLTPRVGGSTTTSADPIDAAGKPSPQRPGGSPHEPALADSKSPTAGAKSRLPSGMKVVSTAGDALLLGQMATADTPEATHGVLVDAVFLPVELSLKYSPQALVLKHVFGVDPLKLKLPVPAMPWSESAKFEDAARRHGQSSAR